MPTNVQFRVERFKGGIQALSSSTGIAMDSLDRNASFTKKGVLKGQNVNSKWNSYKQPD